MRFLFRAILQAGKNPRGVANHCDDVRDPFMRRLGARENPVIHLDRHGIGLVIDLIEGKAIAP
jgi:hypothetical protein